MRERPQPRSRTRCPASASLPSDLTLSPLSSVSVPSGAAVFHALPAVWAPMGSGNHLLTECPGHGAVSCEQGVLQGISGPSVLRKGKTAPTPQWEPRLPLPGPPESPPPLGVRCWASVTVCSTHWAWLWAAPSLCSISKHSREASPRPPCALQASGGCPLLGPVRDPSHHRAEPGRACWPQVGRSTADSSPGTTCSLSPWIQGFPACMWGGGGGHLMLGLDSHGQTLLGLGRVPPYKSLAEANLQKEDKAPRKTFFFSLFLNIFFSL